MASFRLQKPLAITGYTWMEKIGMSIPHSGSGSSTQSIDRERISFAYELILGRAPESEQVFNNLTGRPLEFILAALFEGPEFAANVRRPVRRGSAPVGSCFDAPPRPELLNWAASSLPIDGPMRSSVRDARTWTQLYDRLFADPVFRREANLERGPWSDAELRTLAVLAQGPDGSSRRGAIEAIEGGSIRGWATDLDGLDQPLRVEVWVNDVFSGAGTANGFRRDVQDRFGGSGLTGYVIDVEASRRPTGDARVELIDGQTRRILAAADWPATSPAVEPYESVRAELAQIRQVLERVEAALPALASRQGYAVSDYSDYYEAFYRAPASEAGAARKSSGLSVVFDVTGASAGEVEDGVWSVVNQMAAASDLTLFGAGVDAGTFTDLRNRIDWARRLETPAQDWLKSAPDLAHALQGIASDRVAVMAAPGLLAPDALVRFAEALAAPDVVAAYADEDRLIRQGNRDVHSQPRFKGAFDADQLFQTPYVGDCCAFLASALLASGAQSRPAEAILRLSRGPGRIAHVSRILWTAIGDPDGSTGDWLSIVSDVLADEPDLEIGPFEDGVGQFSAGQVRLRRRPADGISATVIVPTRDRLDLLSPCIESLVRSSPHNLTAMDLRVIDHESREPETLAWLEAAQTRGEIVVDRYQGPFNWALMNNLAADRSEADVLIFLNNDTVVLSQDWLDELTTQALRPGVGVVGARLLFEDGTLQHGGFVARNRVEHYLSHDGVGLPLGDPGYLGRYGLVRRSVAVTGACMAVRRDTFLKLGGFDAARLAVEGNDVDLCLRAQAEGLSVIYNPHATLYHLESKSRGFAREGEAWATSAAAGRIIWDRWSALGIGEADYNAHFDREARPFTRLRPPTVGWPDL